MKPPTYIPLIQEDVIFLKSLSKETKAKLKENNIIVSTQYLTDKVIHTKGDRNKTLIKLNDLDIVFSVDYKQGWAPADIMEDLQEKGILTKPFKSIHWRGPKQWSLQEHFAIYKYHQLKDQGCTEDEVNKICRKDGLDLEQRYLVLKKVFDLNLEQSKKVEQLRID